jgi:pSer/pThr/pTyr-binding forkhead associated (FHA) protein
MLPNSAAFQGLAPNVAQEASQPSVADLPRSLSPAMGVPAAAPRVPGPHSGVASVPLGVGSVPMQMPSRQSPAGGISLATPASGAKPVTAVPATALSEAPAQAVHSSPFSPPAIETIPCPTCGKQVASAFAFCGGCGHRMKSTPGAVGEAAVQRAEAVAPAPIHMAPRGHVTLIRPDGTEGGVYPLQAGENLIGRGQGALFDADPYLSPRHAEFHLVEGGLEVRDHRSLNGIFVRITEEELLESGDSFRIGQELLRFDAINPLTPLEDGTEIIGTPNPGYWGRLSVVVGRDLDGPAFPLFDDTARLGRERGDILFPEDGYVSGAHCELFMREGRVFLRDLGSSNGTFLRVRERRTVPSGSLMLMGQQLFRVAYK